MTEKSYRELKYGVELFERDTNAQKEALEEWFDLSAAMQKELSQAWRAAHETGSLRPVDKETRHRLADLSWLLCVWCDHHSSATGIDPTPLIRFGDEVVESPALRDTYDLERLAMEPEYKAGRDIAIDRLSDLTDGSVAVIMRLDAAIAVREGGEFKPRKREPSATALRIKRIIDAEPGLVLKEITAQFNAEVGKKDALTKGGIRKAIEEHLFPLDYYAKHGGGGGYFPPDNPTD